MEVLAADFEGGDILREMFVTDGSDVKFLGFDLNDMGQTQIRMRITQVLIMVM